jgi:hypothetical protein
MTPDANQPQDVAQRAPGAAYSVQNALLHGPGRFNALALYSYRATELTAEQIRGRVARFLQYVQTQVLPDRLFVLVALHPRVLEGLAHAPAYAPPGVPVPFSLQLDCDVLLQVSAEIDFHRTYALRIAKEILGAPDAACRELLGSRILNAQEPFGFRDGAQNPKAIVEGSLPEGSAWLLYQGFEHNLAKFFREKKTAQERAAVIGHAPVSFPGQPAAPQDRAAVEAAASVLPDTHVKHVNVYKDKLVRRGFPYRENASEGLAFIAVSRQYETFIDALMAMDSMNGKRDPVLQYSRAREGALLFCPPADPMWLDADAANTPPLAAITIDPLARAGKMTAYDTTTGFLTYLMNLRELGLFDNADRPYRVSDEARPHLDALYEVLSRKTRTAQAAKLQANDGPIRSFRPLTPAEQDALSKGDIQRLIPSDVAELKSLEETALENAANVNADNNDYITFG